MLLASLMMFFAPFGADDTAWANQQAAQASLISCAISDIDVHFRDDADARVVARKSLKTCAVELDHFHVALLNSLRSTAPILSDKILDANWADNVEQLVGALEIRVLKLRGVIPKDR